MSRIDEATQVPGEMQASGSPSAPEPAVPPDYDGHAEGQVIDVDSEGVGRRRSPSPLPDDGSADLEDVPVGSLEETRAGDEGLGPVYDREKEQTMSQASELRIEQAPGAISVKHHDAVLGSSNRALVVHGEREAPVYYLPKEDVYFAQMTEVGSGELPGGRTATFWSVVASGGGLERAAWVIGENQDEPTELFGYVGFDPAQLSVEGA